MKERVLNEIPLRYLFWWISDVRDLRFRDLLNFKYSLKIGPQVEHGASLELSEYHRRSLRHVLDWSMDNIKPPKPYEILGKKITPFYEVSYIRRSVVGDIPIDRFGDFATPEGSYTIGLAIRHPTEVEGGPKKTFLDNQLPGEIRELLISIDELPWIHIREVTVSRFRLSEDTLPTHLKRHVFLAYKEMNEQSKQAARRLGEFLEEKGMRVWFFPWRVGWADSITEEEEQAIRDSFGAVICLTPDFLEGRSAREEYRALSAKRRREPDFKLGYLLIGCNHEVVPPFMTDYFGVKIENHEDPKFAEEAMKIHRGLLGLPLESPPSRFVGRTQRAEN